MRDDDLSFEVFQSGDVWDTVDGLLDQHPAEKVAAAIRDVIRIQKRAMRDNRGNEELRSWYREHNAACRRALREMED